MPQTEALPLPKIFHQAERELGAFLHAATDLVGVSGISDASNLWIRTMKEAGCPGGDHAEFFRSVTIRAVAQLTQQHISWSAPPSCPTDLAVTIAA